ncbi:MAG: sterol desaturase family protein [Pirellulales bacterium]
MYLRMFGLTPALAAAMIGMYVVMGIVEWFLPAEKGHSWAGRFRNFTYTLIYLGVGTLLLNQLLRVLPNLQKYVQQHDYPILIAVIYLVVFDFFYYWYHRAQHRWSLLWRIHELHHSDTELNITTSLRTHWLEKPVQQCLVMLPTVLVVGVDIAALYWTAIIGQLWEMATHANVRWHLPRMANFVCNPGVHRVHHSRLKEHHHCNFAQFLTVYDMIFGTYIAPDRKVLPPTGTDTVASDYSVIGNMFRPFLPRRSAGGEGEPVPSVVTARAGRGRRRKKKRRKSPTR